MKMTDASWNTAMARLRKAQEDFVSGDAAGIKKFYSHREDVTVFGGFGGYQRGWAEVGLRLEWAASQFAGGTYSQKDLSTTVGSGVACLVSLERWSYFNAGDRADTVLELRVTQVFRREDGEWRLIHRHADHLTEKAPPSADSTAR
jgi:ketosteroid isomerase-like protein